MTEDLKKGAWSKKITSSNRNILEEKIIARLRETTDRSEPPDEPTVVEPEVGGSEHSNDAYVKIELILRLLSDATKLVKDL